MTNLNMIRRRGALALLIGAVFAASASCKPQDRSQDKSKSISGQSQAVEIFLVRHAEKTADKDDPALTDEGQARAILLADMLADAGITAIHSSDYRRTRDTAAPLAAKLGLTVQIYDPRDLPAMAARLRHSGGRHLVVGHSNTTPQLTELLGGDGGAPIIEATEYNRLYYVTIGAGGDASSALLRFGD